MFVFRPENKKKLENERLNSRFTLISPVTSLELRGFRLVR